MTKKQEYRMAIGIICIVFVFWGGGKVTCAFAASYECNQVILSWTMDNAHTQTITWKGKENKAGYVQYCQAGRRFSPKQQVKAKIITIKKNQYYRYEADIKGLYQGTTYEYRMGDGENWSPTYSFTTAPMAPDGLIQSSKDGKNFDFLYLGDVQYKERSSDYPAWGAFIKNAYARNPKIKFALLGGDMVNYPNSLKEWNLFLDSATSLFSQIPMMTVIGNHETSHGKGLYEKMLALPENGPQLTKEEFYSFDYGDCHIVGLNTNLFMADTKERERLRWHLKKDEINQWLAEDLIQSQAKWKIVFMHHPAYGISDGSSVYEEIRKEWVPKFQEGGVDLVLCGHQHIYMRSEEIGGITYIMGNSGEKRSTYYNGENFPEYGKALDATNSNYQIIRVREKSLSVTSYDDQGQIIDKWTKKSNRPMVIKVVAAIIILIFLSGLVMLARIFWFRRDT